MDTIDRILELLEKKGVSGAEMSRACGFSNAVFSQWKNRKQNPSATKIAKMAEYFGVSVDYLLGNEEKPAAPKDDEPEVKETLTDMAKRAAEGALLMYDGEPLDAETQRAFEASLRVVIATLEGRRGK
ncbi:MAG: helix-turn-helix domain-containing protein [Ruthenibacterium lactatiformans]|jgi:transcriptional regulator with XRE-family HTH domain